MEGISSLRTPPTVDRIATTTTAAEEVKPNETASVTEQEGQTMTAPKDEYISSEKADIKPTGLYSVKKDSDGNTTIRYDDPRKKVISDEESSTQGNRLNNLKSQRDRLKLQIKQEADDSSKVQSLRKKLAAVEKQIKSATN